MSTLSVVIPAYNAGSGLPLTLAAVQGQELPADVALEVIVVDDGSDDRTPDILRTTAATWSALSPLRLARDGRNSRARARNFGIAHSRTDRLLLLDATVALPSGWIRDALALMRDECDVVLGETLGLIPGVRWPSSVPAPAHPREIQAAIESLIDRPDWKDIRCDYFDLDDINSQDACPWTLAWTSAMVLHRSLLMRAGHFDETFLGWGGEDVEFSLRLWKAGAAFRQLRSSLALHCPHESEAPSDKVESMRRNMRKIHEKHPCLETEAFALLGHFAGAFIGRLESLPLEQLVVPYSPEFASRLRDQLQASGRSIVVGSPLHLAKQLPSTHLLAINRRQQAHLTRGKPGSVIRRALGSSLPEPDRSFNQALVTEFFGGLGTAVQLAIIDELLRVAGRASFVCAPDSTGTEVSSALGWQRLTEVHLRRLAAVTRISVRRCFDAGERVLLELSRGPEH